MQDIDLELLRCFAAVADLRNFTAAGARLGRSQSAVSIRIKKLEDLLGCQLLIRSNQSVELTDQGKTLLPKARGLLEGSERLLAQMRGPSVSGRLRIGLLEYIAPQRLPQIMTAMQRKLPSAELQFHVGLSSSLKTALAEGRLDLALALHDPKSETSKLVAKDQLVWVESEHSDQQLADEDIKLCLMHAPCVYRQTAIETLSRLGVGFHETISANSIQSVRNAVMSGLGVSVLGSSCLGAELRPSAHLNSLSALPTVGLSLHGTDHRKDDVTDMLQAILKDSMVWGGQAIV